MFPMHIRNPGIAEVRFYMTYSPLLIEAKKYLFTVVLIRKIPIALVLQSENVPETVVWKKLNIKR